MSANGWNTIYKGLFLGLVLTSLFTLPKQAKAELVFPQTACDTVFEHGNENDSFITTFATKEDGTKAFTYGSNGKSFVSENESAINFSFDILMPNLAPVDLKLDIMDGNCRSISGTATGDAPELKKLDNTLSLRLSDLMMTLNGVEISQIVPNGYRKYLYFEVIDGFPIHTNTYSYIVDITNIQNPTGFVGSEPSGKRPVLIIPGIMGTEIFKGDEKLWPDVTRMFLTNNDRFMDPLAYNADNNPVDSSLAVGQVITTEPKFDYSQGLIDELKLQGYDGTSIYTFPYDWRKDLDEVATNELKNRIDQILADTGFNKIDVVAHSQGGLVMKRLIYDQPEYANKINKLIFVGTPNLGAPKAAKVLLYGDSMAVELLNLGLDPAEVQRITQNMPSVYELLPSKEYLSHGQNYLADAKFFAGLITGYTYLNYDQSKQKLEDLGLNSVLIDKAEAFHNEAFDNYNFDSSGIETYNIVGCQEATIDAVLAGKKGNYRLTYGAGDGTVPLVSASNIFGTSNYFAKKSSHGTLLTEDGTRQLIVNLISGSNLTTNNITQDDSECKYDGKKISVHSPLEIHIYDKNNNHAGPIANGFENNIPGAQYDIIDGEKFIFLPTNENQEYMIQGIGSDTGTFDLLITDQEKDIEKQTQLFDNIKIIPGSLVSFTVSANSDNSFINFDFDNSGKSDTVQASGLFNTEEQAFDVAISDPKPEAVLQPITGGTGAPPAPPKDENTNNKESGKILGEAIDKIPDGTLVLDSTDGRTVYMIGNQGKKYGFTSKTAFLGLGFRFRNVVVADASKYELGGLVSQTKQGHPNGTLVTDGKTIWQIRENKLFGFSNLESFYANGFNLKAVVKLSSTDKLLN